MKKWSIRDDLELYDLQPNFIASDIAKKLGTSKEDVRARVKLLGLRNFDGKAPFQHIIYRVLELHKDTVDNRFLIAGVLNITIKGVTTYYNREKRERKSH